MWYSENDTNFAFMIEQFEIQLKPRTRGFHLITEEVISGIGKLPDAGILHLFILHTSAGLTINENSDPAVLADFERYFNHIVPEDLKGLEHTLEGPDDMPSHIKSTLSGASVSVPVRDGRIYLGTWQGIYLCEFRNNPRPRSLLATLYS